jgi:S1-C subfamily serine protease
MIAVAAVHASSAAPFRTPQSEALERIAKELSQPPVTPGQTFDRIGHDLSQLAPVPAVSSDVLIDIVVDREVSGKPTQVHETCSGVIIGADLIATDKHCTPEGAKLTVTTDKGGQEGDKFDAAVLRRSDNADVALLRTEKPMGATIAKLGCYVPPIGTPIEIVGNPLGVNFVHTWGRIAGAMRDASDASESHDTHLIPVDASFASGNSGGPAYDLNTGEVVGMADIYIDGSAGGGAGSVKLIVSSIAVCDLLGS